MTIPADVSFIALAGRAGGYLSRAAPRARACVCVIVVLGVYRTLPHTFTTKTWQAGPSNAVFFVFYDALNALGTAALLGGSTSAGGAGPYPPAVPAALHLGASSIATVPTNLVRTPAEVVKQRLQVCTIYSGGMEVRWVGVLSG